MQCRNLSVSIKYLSSNFLLAVLVSELNNLAFSTARFIKGLDGDIEVLVDARTILYSLFVALTWCSLCAIALERFIALVFPLHYSRYVTELSLGITIAVVWLSNLLIHPSILFFSWFEMCGRYDYIQSCDRFSIFRPVRISMTSLSGIITFITVVIYTKISLVIRHHTKEIAELTVKDQETTTQNDSYSRPLPSTNIILAIILSFIILQSPILINFIIFELRPDLQLQQVRTTFHMIIFIFGEINTFIILYLYVWRFKECRMNFYRMLSKLSDRYRAKAEALRIEVFNIVTFSKDDETNIEKAISQCRIGQKIVPWKFHDDL